MRGASGILTLLVVGGIAGWLASVLKRSRRTSLLANVVLGVLGALLGGFVIELLGGAGVTGFNLWSLFVATAGAVALISLMQALRRR